MSSTAATVSDQDGPLERRLLLGVRVAAALVGLTLAAMGFVYYRQLSSPSLGAAERDVRSLEQRVRERPEDVELRASVAHLYVEQGRYAEAAAQAEQVLEVSPGHVGAGLALVRAYEQQARVEQAMQVLADVVEAQRGNPMARVSLQLGLAYQFQGQLAMRQGQLERALAAFDEALTIDRGNAETLYLRGKVLASQGRLEDAIASFRRALRFVPEFPEAYAELVRAYDALGDLAWGQYAWGMVRYSAGEYDQAIETLQQAARSLGDQAEVHLGLAMAYERGGRLAEALQEFRRTADLDTGSIAARQGIARVGGLP